jgi:predicted nucleotidyltransferase
MSIDVASIRDSLAAVLAADTRLGWAYLFGSLAGKGRGRDVDVAIMPIDEAWGLLDTGRLQAELAMRLGAGVDVVDLRDADLPFAGPMLQNRVLVLDRRRDERLVWEAETMSRWLDMKPIRERFSKARLAALARRRG